MAIQRATTRQPAPPARRPPLPAARVATPQPVHAAQLLQQRLGNRAVHAALVHVGAPAAVTGASPAPDRTPAPARPAAGMPAARAASSPERASGGARAAPAQASSAPEAVRAPAKPAAAAAPAPSGAAAAAGEAAPPSPREAVGPAIGAVRHRAAAARRHGPAGAAVASAQASAVHPHTEQVRGAAVQTVGGMDAAKTDAVRRSEFKAKLKKAIQDATPQPKSEDEANRVMKEGGTQASGTLRGQLATERDAAVGPLKSAAGTEAPASAQPAPPATTLQVQPAGPPPAPVSAAPVVPAPLPAQRLDYSADHAPTEEVMAQNNVTPEQLKKGNDPAFGPTLDARAAAEKHEATAAATYRGQEAKVQADAQARAHGALAHGLGGIHAGRVAQLGSVGDKQHGTAAKDAERRKQVTADITAIKDRTRAAVEKILDGLDTEAAAIFDRGLKRAEASYDAAFEEAKGGIGTWLTTWGSDWDKHIAGALGTARSEYMRQVDSAIDEVADFVDRKIKEAKDRVASGRKEIDTLVAGLDANLRQAGEDARDAVSGDFDAMTSMIDERRDALVDKLVQQYKASYERMSAREEELREANKSLWQRAYDATVGLIKKIIAFKDMLLGLLGRAAGVISDIMADPIGFLGNLISGVMAGLRNFMSNIGSHLKKGLMDWLFGALAGAGLTLPDTFDLKGILSIVLQILGLTYANFRARAVAIVGEPIVAGLEQAAEVFKVFLTEGVGGLWRFIKEKVADLKSMVLDAIFDFIKEKVIIAGVTWIIGLLNPASAFFKACKAIYDIVMFFINRGSQILSLVNAIVDSLAAIVKGNVSVAATFVENALAKAVPVAIGFLASLLGLGDPSKPVRNTIEKAQSPVNKAIDWVIHGAVKLVKAAGGLVRGLVGKKTGDEKVPHDDDDPRRAAKIAAGLAALDAEEAKLLKDGELTAADAQTVTRSVKNAHPVFKSLTPVDAGDHWRYRYTASPPREHESPNKKGAAGSLDADSVWEAAVQALATARTATTKLDELSVSNGKAEVRRIFAANNVPAAQADRALAAIDDLLERAGRETSGDAISARMRSVSGIANQTLEAAGSGVRINAHHVERVSESVATFPKTKRERLHIPKRYMNAITKWAETPGRSQTEILGLLRDQLLQDKYETMDAPLKEVAMIITTSGKHVDVHKQSGF